MNPFFKINNNKQYSKSMVTYISDYWNITKCYEVIAARRKFKQHTIVY